MFPLVIISGQKKKTFSNLEFIKWEKKQVTLTYFLPSNIYSFLFILCTVWAMGGRTNTLILSKRDHVTNFPFYYVAALMLGEWPIVEWPIVVSWGQGESSQPYAILHYIQLVTFKCIQVFLFFYSSDKGSLRGWVKKEGECCWTGGS